MVITKLLGIGSIILGLSIIIFVPTAIGHQPPPISNAAIIIGIIFLALGFFLFSL